MKSERHLAYLDGWRGIAILLVLMCHFALGGEGPLGTMGVALFFVLSGRLMGDLLFVRRVPLLQFFARRVSRILPVFWLYIIVLYSAVNLLNLVEGGIPLREPIYGALFLRTYFPSDVELFAAHWGIGHFWSLNVEEHSYLFLAAAALLIRRIVGDRNQVWLLLLCTIAVLCTAVYYQFFAPPGLPRWRLRSEVASLGLVASATLVVARHKWPGKCPSILPVSSFIAALACIFYITNLADTFAPILFALTCAYADCLPATIRNALSSRALRWLGKCSFSLYIWQQPFFSFSTHSKSSPTVLLMMAIAIGTASFYLIENPARRWLNARTARLNEASETALSSETLSSPQAAAG